jgi:hypothetical protein
MYDKIKSFDEFRKSLPVFYGTQTVRQTLGPRSISKNMIEILGNFMQILIFATLILLQPWIRQ